MISLSALSATTAHPRSRWRRRLSAAWRTSLWTISSSSPAGSASSARCSPPGFAGHRHLHPGPALGCAPLRLPPAGQPPQPPAGRPAARSRCAGAALEQLSGAVVMITFNALILRLAGNTGVCGLRRRSKPEPCRAVGLYRHRAGQPAAGQPGLGPGPRGGRAAGAALCADLRARLCGGGLRGVFLRHGADRGDLQQRSRPRLAAHGRAGAAALLPRAAVRGGQRRACDPTLPQSSRPARHRRSRCCAAVVVIVPAALALSALFALPGVWLAFPVSEAIVAVVALALLVRGRKPEKV